MFVHADEDEEDMEEISLVFFGSHGQSEANYIIIVIFSKRHFLNCSAFMSHTHTHTPLCSVPVYNQFRDQTMTHCVWVRCSSLHRGGKGGMKRRVIKDLSSYQQGRASRFHQWAAHSSLCWIHPYQPPLFWVFYLCFAHWHTVSSCFWQLHQKTWGGWEKDKGLWCILVSIDNNFTRSPLFFMLTVYPVVHSAVTCCVLCILGVGKFL